MRKVLVTGASGFIGTHLCRTLKQHGHRVLGLDRAGNSNGLDPASEFILGDILEVDWGPILSWGPDVMIHLAETANVGKSFQDLHAEIANSLMVTSFVLEKWKLRPSMKLLYVSSAAVYGNQTRETYHEDLPCAPVSPYGVCKHASEQLVRIAAAQHGLSYVIARPFSVYGTGLKKQVVYDLTRRFLSERAKIVVFGTGKEKRDFVNVRDCCSSLSKIADSIETVAPATVNIGTGKATTLSTLVSLIAAQTGCREEYEFAGKDAPGNPEHLIADTTRLGTMGVECTIALEDGLPEVIDSIRNGSR